MIRSFQWDLARQVERLDWLLDQLPRYADWGYQEVHLHLEDAVEYPSLPGVARRDAYTYRQFTQLVDAATRVGIKVVPIVNLLGHTQYLIKVPELRDLNELRAPDGSPLERGQICPLHPRTLEIAEKLLRDMAPFCTAGKVHVGLDESFHLGKHPLSQKEIRRIGLAAHFAGHVNRLHELTRSLGLQMGLWADMLYFLPDAIPLLPTDVTAYEWYYHAFRRWPRVELFSFAEVDIATPLKQHGIQLYGCPMNGAFRYEPLPHFGDRLANIIAWWRHAKRIGAQGFLVSSWEPYRLAIELTTVVDAAAASLWLEPEITEPREMLARGFARAFPKFRRARTTPPYRAWADLALACDHFPFSGYPRWEINDRWDTVSRRESRESHRKEEKHFSALLRRSTKLDVPASLRASVEFRHYLAVRDCSVREIIRDPVRTRAAQATFRAAQRVGLKAAQTMWNQTRDRRVVCPNEQIVRTDRERLNALRRGDSVFGGKWQLCYRVWNFAPAVQLVGVEQQQPDSQWKLLQSCHTIEFQTAAARPRGAFVREHAAAVTWDSDQQPPPILRLIARGVGEVKIRDVALTDGRRVLRPRGWTPTAWRRLGCPAPSGGLPEIDWLRTTDAIALEFIARPRRETKKPGRRGPG
jgi:hypothetical protein